MSNNQSQPTTNPNSKGKTFVTKKLTEQKTSTEKSNGQGLSQDKTHSSSSSIMTDKANRIAKQQALENSTIMFEATATSPESGKQFKVPLRAAITNKDKDLDVTKTSIWVLMTLNQCTMKEVEEFEKTYKDDLTYSEKMSIKLLKDALRGNKQAQQVYWNLMEKVANRPKVLNQINLTEVNVGKGSVMTDLLDQITKNIKGSEAQEGEIVV